MLFQIHALAASVLSAHLRLTQSDLISALCVDAYESAADALAAARDAAPAGDHARAWADLCRAYRQWALARPADFALIFGTPQPGYQAPGEITAPAAARFTGIPFGVYAAAVQAGAADPGRTQIPPGLQTGALWKTLLGDRPPDGDPRLAGIMLSAWVSVLGYLAAEIFGSLAELISDPGEFYQAHIRAVMLGVGFQPDLVRQAATGEA